MKEETYRLGRYNFNVTNIKKAQVRHKPEELYIVLEPEEADLVIDNNALARTPISSMLNILLDVYSFRYFLYSHEYKFMFTVGTYEQQIQYVHNADMKVRYLLAYHSTNSEVLKELLKYEKYDHIIECATARLKGENPKWYIW